jgi:chromosomal replication initiator protein
MHHGVEISPPLLNRLVSDLDPHLTPRQLESVIKDLSLWQRMHASPLTEEAIRSAVDKIGRGGEVSMSAITRCVARYYRLKTAELRSGSRKKQIVRARSLAMHLARRFTSKSMHQIGEYFGGRDHTTVLHAIRKTESLMHQDADLQRAADDVAEKLSESFSG